MISDAELAQRYSRHLTLPQIGSDGQRRLLQARVLCVGAGGLGCPALMYLTAAGIGTITVVDGDRVELSNLQRQVLFSEADIGRAKAEAAVDRLRAMNSTTRLRAVPSYLDGDNAGLVAEHDIVLDCTDSLDARFLINDRCIAAQRPWVYASVQQFHGQLAVFADIEQGCFRCLFPRPPENAIPNCAEAGVVGALPGTLGTLQALQAIKCLLAPESIEPRLSLFDGLSLDLRHFSLRKDPDCPSCVHRQTYQPASAAGGGGDGEADRPLPTLSPQQLRDWLNAGQPVHLVDVRSAQEHAGFNLGGEHLSLEQLRADPHELERRIDDKSCPVVFYCQRGQRSRLAVDRVRDLGYDCYSLESGVEGWLASELGGD